MSSFVQAQPVIYGTSLGCGGYRPSPAAAPTSADCYYAAGCQDGRTVVGETLYGAGPVNPRRCYASGADYDAEGYGRQRPGYDGRYVQQQQQQQRMFLTEYQPANDIYGGACSRTTAVDQPPPRAEPAGPALYVGGGEQLVRRQTDDSPSSAGLIPASSPGSTASFCSRYTPPSAPPAAVPQCVSNAPRPPVIYPWMKMVHSISGELYRYHTRPLLRTYK